MLHLIDKMLCKYMYSTDNEVQITKHWLKRKSMNSIPNIHYPLKDDINRN